MLRLNRQIRSLIDVLTHELAFTVIKLMLVPGVRFTGLDKAQLTLGQQRGSLLKSTAWGYASFVTTAIAETQVTVPL